MTEYRMEEIDGFLVVSPVKPIVLTADLPTILELTPTVAVMHRDRFGIWCVMSRDGFRIHDEVQDGRGLYECLTCKQTWEFRCN